MTESRSRLTVAGEGLIGALQVAGMLIAWPLLRGWYRRWGTTPTEAAQPLPGDELVPNSRITYTRAVTIDAPPAAVWPWLVQIGQGRGGLYSYDALENLVGCDIHSVDRILPEHQTLEAGDQVRYGPPDKTFPGQIVVEVAPEQHLLMQGMDPATRELDTQTSWAFYLRRTPDGKTRLLVRGRNGTPPTPGNVILWGMVDAVTFVMERKMLLGIKQRAEAAPPSTQ